MWHILIQWKWITNEKWWKYSVIYQKLKKKVKIKKKRKLRHYNNK